MSVIRAMDAPLVTSIRHVRASVKYPACLRILETLFLQPVMNQSFPFGRIPLMGDCLVAMNAPPYPLMVTKPTLQRSVWLRENAALSHVFKKRTSLACIQSEGEIALVALECRLKDTIGEIWTEFQHQTVCQTCFDGKTGFLDQRPARPLAIRKTYWTTATLRRRILGIEWMM